MFLLPLRMGSRRCQSCTTLLNEVWISRRDVPLRIQICRIIGKRRTAVSGNLLERHDRTAADEHAHRQGLYSYKGSGGLPSCGIGITDEHAEVRRNVGKELNLEGRLPV